LVVLSCISRIISSAIRGQTKCIVMREVPLVFRAMNRNGFGAACTAVLEKLRFPRISWAIVSEGDVVKLHFPYLKRLDLHLWACFIQVLRNDNVGNLPSIQRAERSWRLGGSSVS
jgi:hypothetical protein